MGATTTRPRLGSAPSSGPAPNTVPNPAGLAYHERRAGWGGGCGVARVARIGSSGFERRPSAPTTAEEAERRWWRRRDGRVRRVTTAPQLQLEALLTPFHGP